MADVFALSFADCRDHIHDLRARDSGFAAICRDYETLVALLPRDADDPSLIDIKDSLAGLDMEIRACLARDNGDCLTKPVSQPQRRDHPDAG